MSSSWPIVLIFVGLCIAAFAYDAKYASSVEAPVLAVPAVAASVTAGSIAAAK